MPNLFASHQFRDWRSERETQRAALNPQAYQFCKFLEVAWRYCAYVSLLGIPMVVIGLDIGSARNPHWLTIAGLAEMASCLGLALFCFLFRFAIIAMVFTRYSMLHLISLILVINGLETMFVLLPSYFKAIPVVLGAWLTMICCGYVIGQDPKAGQRIPEFIRTRVVAKKFSGVKQS